MMVDTAFPRAGMLPVWMPLADISFLFHVQVSMHDAKHEVWANLVVDKLGISWLKHQSAGEDATG